MHFCVVFLLIVKHFTHCVAMMNCTEVPFPGSLNQVFVSKLNKGKKVRVSPNFVEESYMPKKEKQNMLCSVFSMFPLAGSLFLLFKLSVCLNFQCISNQKELLNTLLIVN